MSRGTKAGFKKAVEEARKVISDEDLASLAKQIEPSPMTKAWFPAPDLSDPWKHRSAHMTCASCMAFILKAPSPTVGRCRRRSPGTDGAGWPVVMASDWCLDHKLDETKVGVAG